MFLNFTNIEISVTTGVISMSSDEGSSGMSAWLGGLLTAVILAGFLAIFLMKWIRQCRAQASHMPRDIEMMEFPLPSTPRISLSPINQPSVSSHISDSDESLPTPSDHTSAYLSPMTPPIPRRLFTESPISSPSPSPNRHALARVPPSPPPIPPPTFEPRFTRSGREY